MVNRRADDLRRVGAITALIALGPSGGAFAADADHPYQNIDPRVDAGNPTGDDEVERLNGAQLGRLLARPHRSWWDRGPAAPVNNGRFYRRFYSPVYTPPYDTSEPEARIPFAPPQPPLGYPY